MITADGTYLIATPTKHRELFWALNGGAGGTYGVVLSMTTMIHKEEPIAGASLWFKTGLITDETFWEGINAFHALLEPIVNIGNSILYQITNSAEDQEEV